MINPLLASALLALALVAPTQAREITHAMGVTEVPDAPVRVAILTNEGTEALLHLGVVPVGAAQSWQGNPFYPHLADQLADTVSLGTETAINLEVLASLQPDVIIGTVFRHEKVYEQLSAIAPTVLSATIGPQWLENYEFYGRTVGLGDRAAANAEAFRAQAAALGDAIGDRVDEEVSLVRFAVGRTRIYSDHSFAGVVLDLVGFRRPALQQSQDTFVQIGKERIPEMDADRIFYFAPDDDNAESMANLEEWLNDPLFVQLDASRAGKVTRVRELSWNLGGGIYSAHMMLEELADIYDVTLPPQAD